MSVANLPLTGSGRHRSSSAGGSGSALLPGPRRCQDFDLLWSKPWLGVIVLVLVPAGLARSPARAVVAAGNHVRARPGARTWRRGRPRRSAAAREAAGEAQATPRDCLPLTTGAFAFGWPHVSPRCPRSYWHPSARLPHFGHIAPQPARPVGRALEPVEKVVTGFYSHGCLSLNRYPSWPYAGQYGRGSGSWRSARVPCRWLHRRSDSAQLASEGRPGRATVRSCPYLPRDSDRWGSVVPAA